MSSVEINGEIIVIQDPGQPTVDIETSPGPHSPPHISTVPQIGVAIQGPPGPAGEAGPAGPQGPQGVPGGTNFTFSQMSASTVWTIPHNLGWFPPVTIVNEEGDVVYGDVNYASNDVVIVTFSAAFSGIAYLG
jgi:hypothetical protein